MAYVGRTLVIVYSNVPTMGRGTSQLALAASLAVPFNWPRIFVLALEYDARIFKKDEHSFILWLDARLIS